VEAVQQLRRFFIKKCNAITNQKFKLKFRGQRKVEGRERGQGRREEEA
jgi:hypothetical protein